MESPTKTARLSELKRKSLASSGKAAAATKRPDLLRRFTPTPYAADLRVMQRTVRLETNSRELLDVALKFFDRHQHGETTPREFLWRITCEPDPRVQSTAVQLAAFSDAGLRYVNVEQRGFLAVDLDRREAVGSLPDLFVESGPELRNNRPLDILFCMTAPALGLTALAGGCVAADDRGVMIFGPPNSGKTTACYLAGKLGLEFNADQGVFLDLRGKVLRAWGDLFPAVFRPESLDFLPELRESSRRATNSGITFYYVEKSPFQARLARPVVPVCSLFLERGLACEPKLHEIDPDKALSKLRACLLFDEDSRFDAQMAEALTALAARPVYSLQYGNDPKIAAAFIEKLLR